MWRMWVVKSPIPKRVLGVMYMNVRNDECYLYCGDILRAPA